MKLRMKLALLSMASGAIAFQFGLGSCARFLGDLAGDIFFLQAID